VPLRHFTEVADNQAPDEHAAPPKLAVTMLTAPPKFIPLRDASAPPVVGKFPTAAETTGESNENTLLAVPTRDETDS
jgi:hypothetical protein